MSSSRCRQTQVPDAKHAHVGQLACKVGVRYVSVEDTLKDAGQLGFVGCIGVYPLRYRVCAFKRRACPSWRHSACGCRVCAATTSPLKGSGSGSSSSPRRSVLLCLRFWSRCHWALVWRVSSLRAAGTSTSSVPYGSSSFAAFLAKPCLPESLKGAFCFKLHDGDTLGFGDDPSPQEPL